LFNLENFDIKLDTEYLGREFIYFEEVDSTNNELMKYPELLPNGAVLLAESQTNGKGRTGKTWISNPEQNLTFSILLNEDLDKFSLPLLNLTTALSVGQAIENLFQLDINLKWPNDVLVKNNKIAGILVESKSKSNLIEKVIIGIGINVNQPIFKGNFEIHPTSVLKELKREVSRERLLSEFLNIFEENIETLVYNPKEILQNWKNKCKMLDGKIKIINGEIVKVGKFIDVDNEGFLVLRKNDNSLETIAFGDVSIREQD